jgi:hypothetical protein
MFCSASPVKDDSAALQDFVRSNDLSTMTAKKGGLNGDDAVETCIASLVHLPYATRADRQENFVRAELVL